LGIQLYKEPVLEKPIMVACWPGVGNIGTVTGETLIKHIAAEELGEIEAWDFFYPRKVSIRSGVLENLEFPNVKFYFKKLAQRDVIISVGDEEPGDDGGPYAQGKKAYTMGNLVLDVAEKFGCRRIYTSCAAISSSHHGFRSKVWAATSHEYLKKEARGYRNTILRSEAEGRPRYSSIPGMKGLLLGLAATRGMEAICLMGEIPDYLTRVPLPYPRASKAVFEVLCDLLGVPSANNEIDEMITRLDGIIAGVVEQFSPEIKERIAQRKSVLQATPETITEDDENWIKEHLDDLFKKGGGGE
jgi:uncharacterized protein